MKTKLRFLAILLLLVTQYVSADWHGGKIDQLNVGYDGTSITFKLEGWNRADCTCYSAWPNSMCLDATRQTHDFEKAMLLSARARGSVVHANIDETTCKVVAIYEITN